MTQVKVDTANPSMLLPSPLYIEGNMATVSHARLSISGLGWGLSAALIVLFVLCMLLAPTRLAYGWVNLVSNAPIDSAQLWTEGLGWSLVIGWLIALVCGSIYNLVVALQEMGGH